MKVAEREKAGNGATLSSRPRMAVSYLVEILTGHGCSVWVRTIKQPSSPLQGQTKIILESFIAQYDQNGTLLWAQTSGMIGNDFATGLFDVGDGNVFFWVIVISMVGLAPTWQRFE